MRKCYKAQNTVEFALMLVFVGVIVFLMMSHIEGPIKEAFERMAPRKQVHVVQNIIYKNVEKTAQMLLDIYEKIKYGNLSEISDEALIQILESGSLETSGSMANILTAMLNSNPDFVSAYGRLDEDQTLEEMIEEFPAEEQALLKEMCEDLEDKEIVLNKETVLDEDGSTLNDKISYFYTDVVAHMQTPSFITDLTRYGGNTYVAFDRSNPSLRYMAIAANYESLLNINAAGSDLNVYVPYLSADKLPNIVDSNGNTVQLFNQFEIDGELQYLYTDISDGDKPVMRGANKESENLKLLSPAYDVTSIAVDNNFIISDGEKDAVKLYTVADGVSEWGNSDLKDSVEDYVNALKMSLKIE